MEVKTFTLVVHNLSLVIRCMFRKFGICFLLLGISACSQQLSDTSSSPYPNSKTKPQAQSESNKETTNTPAQIAQSQNSQLTQNKSIINEVKPPELLSPVSVEGKWITEKDGSTLLDPQTSGLIADENVWWSVSDASAHDSQTHRLHMIDKNSVKVVERLGPMVISDRVANSCFSSYLSKEPDYEAMVFHPYLKDAWILVTEDASRGKHKQLSGDCKKRFENTGSTKYPTLLVEIMLRNEQLIVSGVRALQFSPDDKVGNLPNDGFEGLAFGRDNRLFLSLETDSLGQARIFYIDLDRNYFEYQDSFSLATDAELHLPSFTEGKHPINGMSIHFPDEQSKGFLIAAARNDNQIWIIDISKEQATKILPMNFYAPPIDDKCTSAYKMHNSSIEGVAVDGDTLILVNDPWRSQYRKNIVCEYDSEPYQRYSSLIFTTPLLSEWFRPQSTLLL